MRYLLLLILFEFIKDVLIVFDGSRHLHSIRPHGFKFGFNFREYLFDKFSFPFLYILFVLLSEFHVWFDLIQIHFEVFIQSELEIQ